MQNLPDALSDAWAAFELGRSDIMPLPIQHIGYGVTRKDYWFFYRQAKDRRLYRYKPRGASNQLKLTFNRAIDQDWVPQISKTISMLPSTLPPPPKPALRKRKRDEGVAAPVDPRVEYEYIKELTRRVEDPGDVHHIADRAVALLDKIFN